MHVHLRLGESQHNKSAIIFAWHALSIISYQRQRRRITFMRAHNICFLWGHIFCFLLPYANPIDTNSCIRVCAPTYAYSHMCPYVDRCVCVCVCGARILLMCCWDVAIDAFFWPIDYRCIDISNVVLLEGRKREFIIISILN